ncbi:60S ribosomal protein L28 [Laetiporus sulphureus 93-53]|uniref:60S ribosomal protein L28 n=1 Tax=Laetiporus sulphureus 93-53 TaxID=1314785 RepID=A0A165C1F1_9APHY|nr:60S ribosomal protein L28 [Laetiporus sulphureus 93-53]KZT02027.1 60S ribosomal protein L28 [Laetiporus sulphureus 93-53]
MASNDLQWLLLRKHNSFFVKKVAEGPIFSKEPGNLTNLHSHKYSGLSNSKTIDVSATEGGVKLTTRKKGASPHAVHSSFVTSAVRPRSGTRRALGIAAKLARRGYRPDLRQATLARVSAILESQKDNKPSYPKKLRGKKKNIGL